MTVDETAGETPETEPAPEIGQKLPRPSPRPSPEEEHFEEHSGNAGNAADDAGEPEAGETFDAPYVRKLRAEAARHRKAATTAEAELVELRADRDRRALGDLTRGRLADPDDFARFVQLDELRAEGGKYDPAKVVEALDGLLARKPHLRPRHASPALGARPLPQTAQTPGEILSEALRKRVV